MEAHGQKRGYFLINNKRYSVREGINTIGRNRDASVIIKDTSVSQQQALLVVTDENKHYLSDFNSSNGTYLDSTKLRPLLLYEIKDGAAVKFALVLGSYFKEQNNTEINSQRSEESQHVDNTIFDTRTQIFNVDDSSSSTRVNDHGYPRTAFESQTNYLIGDSYDINDCVGLNEIQPIRGSAEADTSTTDTNADIHDMPTPVRSNEVEPNIYEMVTPIRNDCDKLKLTIHDLPTQILAHDSSDVGEQMQSLSIHELPTQMLLTPSGDEDEATCPTHSKLPGVNTLPTQKPSAATINEQVTQQAPHSASTSINEKTTQLPSKDGNTISNLQTQIKSISVGNDSVLDFDCDKTKSNDQSDVVEETLYEDSAKEKDDDSRDSIDFMTMRCASQFFSGNATPVDSDSESEMHLNRLNKKSRNVIRSDEEEDSGNANIDAEAKFGSKSDKKLKAVDSDSDLETLKVKSKKKNIIESSSDETDAEPGLALTDRTKRLKKLRTIRDIASSDSDTEVEDDVLQNRSKVGEDSCTGNKSGVEVNKDRGSETKVNPIRNISSSDSDTAVEDDVLPNNSKAEEAGGDSCARNKSKSEEVEVNEGWASETDVDGTLNEVDVKKTKGDRVELSKEQNEDNAGFPGRSKRVQFLDEKVDDTDTDIETNAANEPQADDTLNDTDIIPTTQDDFAGGNDRKVENESDGSTRKEREEKKLERSSETEVAEKHNTEKTSARGAENHDVEYSEEEILGDSFRLALTNSMNVSEAHDTENPLTNDVHAHSSNNESRSVQNLNTQRNKDVEKVSADNDEDNTQVDDLDLMHNPTVEASSRTGDVDRLERADDDIFLQPTQITENDRDDLFLQPTQKLNGGTCTSQNNDGIFLQPTQITENDRDDLFLQPTQKLRSSTCPSQNNDSIFLQPTQKLTSSGHALKSQEQINPSPSALDADEDDDIFLQATQKCPEIVEPAKKSDADIFQHPTAPTAAFAKKNFKFKSRSVKPLEDIFDEPTQKLEEATQSVEAKLADIFKPTQPDDDDFFLEATQKVATVEDTFSDQTQKLEEITGSKAQGKEERSNLRKDTIATGDLQKRGERKETRPPSVESQLEVLFASQNVQLLEDENNSRPPNPLLNVFNGAECDVHSDFNPDVSSGNDNLLTKVPENSDRGPTSDLNPELSSGNDDLLREGFAEEEERKRNESRKKKGTKLLENSDRGTKSGLNPELSSGNDNLLREGFAEEEERQRNESRKKKGTKLLENSDRETKSGLNPELSSGNDNLLREGFAEEEERKRNESRKKKGTKLLENSDRAASSDLNPELSSGNDDLLREGFAEKEEPKRTESRKKKGTKLLENSDRAASSDLNPELSSGNDDLLREGFAEEEERKRNESRKKKGTKLLENSDRGTKSGLNQELSSGNDDLLREGFAEEEERKRNESRKKKGTKLLENSDRGTKSGLNPELSSGNDNLLREGFAEEEERKRNESRKKRGTKLLENSDRGTKSGLNPELSSGNDNLLREGFAEEEERKRNESRKKKGTKLLENSDRGTKSGLNPELSSENDNLLREGFEEEEERKRNESRKKKGTKLLEDSVRGTKSGLNPELSSGNDNLLREGFAEEEERKRNESRKKKGTKLLENSDRGTKSGLNPELSSENDNLLREGFEEEEERKRNESRKKKGTKLLEDSVRATSSDLNPELSSGNDNLLREGSGEVREPKQKESRKKESKELPENSGQGKDSKRLRSGGSAHTKGISPNEEGGGKIEEETVKIVNKPKSGNSVIEDISIGQTPRTRSKRIAEAAESKTENVKYEGTRSGRSRKDPSKPPIGATQKADSALCTSSKIEEAAQGGDKLDEILAPAELVENDAFLEGARKEKASEQSLLPKPALKGENVIEECAPSKKLEKVNEGTKEHEEQSKSTRKGKRKSVKDEANKKVSGLKSEARVEEIGKNHSKDRSTTPQSSLTGKAQVPKAEEDAPAFVEGPELRRSGRSGVANLKHDGSADEDKGSNEKGTRNLKRTRKNSQSSEDRASEENETKDVKRTRKSSNSDKDIATENTTSRTRSKSIEDSAGTPAASGRMQSIGKEAQISDGEDKSAKRGKSARNKKGPSSSKLATIEESEKADSSEILAGKKSGDSNASTDVSFEAPSAARASATRRSRRASATSEDDFEASVPKKRKKNVLESDSDTSQGTVLSVPGTPARRRQAVLSESILSTPERNKRKLKPKVVFTMLDSPELESVIRSLGGSVVDGVDSCTVLVTGSVKRSQKLLSAVGQGKPICAPQWLRECKKAGQFLDPWEFVLVDEEAEEKWQFSLKEALQRSAASKLFDNYTVQLVVNNAQDVLKGAIESCGGKCVTRAPPKNSATKYVVVSAPENRNKYSKFLKQKPPPVIVAAEAIFDGVLRQELRFENHLLT